jgi:hypothetical protein
MHRIHRLIWILVALSSSSLRLIVQTTATDCRFQCQVNLFGRETAECKFPQSLAAEAAKQTKSSSYDKLLPLILNEHKD